MFKAIIITFAVSMLPVIELRGAIPIGLGVYPDLPIPVALISALLGNIILVPFIILFTRRVVEWLKTKSPRMESAMTKFENKIIKKASKAKSLEFWGLLLFVAIPLPGTGAWTGSMIAAFFDIKIKNAFWPIAIGVVIAGVIVTAITYGVDALIGAVA